jgi:hypothetical protein
LPIFNHYRGRNVPDLGGEDMVRLFLALLLALPLVAGTQSFNAGTAGTITATEGGDFSVLLRIHTLDGNTFSAPAATGSIMETNNNVFQIRHTTSNQLMIYAPTATGGSGNQFLPSLAGRKDVAVLVAHDRTGLRFRYEIWDVETGAVISSNSYTMSSMSASTWSTITIGDTDNTNLGIAFYRLYSSVAASGGISPHLRTADADVAQLEFEGNATDALGHATSFSGAAYVSTPEYGPICSAGSLARYRSDSAVTMDSSASYANVEGGGSLSYSWRLTAKPAEAVLWWIGGPSAASPTIRGSAYGNYTAALTVTQSNGQATTCSHSWKVVVPEAETPASRNIPVSANLGGAAKVRFTAIDANGSTVDTKTSLTGSATLAIPDPDKGEHLLVVERLNISDVVLSRGTPQPLYVGATSGTARATNYRHIKVSAVMYPAGGIDAQQANWLSSRVDYFILPSSYGAIATGTSDNPKTYNSDAVMIDYKDASGVYIWEDMYKMKEFAEAHGYDWEDMFTHTTTDMDDAVAPWSTTGRFDPAETSTPGPDVTVLQNGVLVCSAPCSSFADESVDAADTGIDDVTFSDTINLGYFVPFDEANWTITTAQVGGTLTARYCSAADGSGNCTTWSTLTLSSDATNQLKNIGTALKMRWTPPANWAQCKLNGSHKKWWVRFVLSGQSVNPIMTQIRGDSWDSTVSTKEIRGWDSDDPNIIMCCGGSIPYNPTPPANATARFRHQARIKHFFTSTQDAFVTNQATLVGGINPFMHWMGDLWVNSFTETGYDGLMLDNGDSYAESALGPDGSWYGYMAEWPALPTSYHDSLQASYAWLDNYIDTQMGANKWIGRNAGYFTVPISLTPDFTLLENFRRVRSDQGFGHPAGSISFPIDYSGSGYLYTLSTAGPDTFKTANNPDKTKGIVHMLDNIVGYSSTGIQEGGAAAQAGRGFDNGYFAWEKRNRRPLTALAYYYLGANENTWFAYNTFGTTYNASDQVRYHTGGTTTLAADLNADTSTSLKTISLTDATGIAVSSIVMIGGTVANHDGEHILLSGGSKTGNDITFTSRVFNTYPAGTTVHIVSVKNQSDADFNPDTACYYANWFPAIAADVGSPNPAGHNGGERDTAWITGATIGDGGSNIYRRDYTKAIILLRPATTSSTAAHYNTLQPSGSTSLGGGTYYKLLGSGKTDPTPYTCIGTGGGCIGIRAGEGLILMNYEIP